MKKRWHYYIEGKEVTEEEAKKQIAQNYVALEFMKNNEKSSWAVFRHIEMVKE